MNKLKVYTDGASRDNPGRSGIGIIITDETGKIILKHNEYIGIATNNIAEYRALLKSLDFIKDIIIQRKINHIDFYTDSELMSNQINGFYKVKNNELKKLYNEFIETIKKININYKIHHIERRLNKEADKLANISIDEELRKPKQI